VHRSPEVPCVLMAVRSALRTVKTDPSSREKRGLDELAFRNQGPPCRKGDAEGTSARNRSVVYSLWVAGSTECTGGAGDHARP
jgi:hypothetical protein